MHQDKIKVIHSSPVWLPQTQTWMYNQVHQLTKQKVDCYVVCERTENLSQFSVPNIYSLNEESKLRYYWDKGLRKSGIRRHLGFLIQIAKRTGAQIIHSHFGYNGWADLGAASKAKMRHIVTFYGRDVNMMPTQDFRWNARYHTLFAQADLFLCEGPHMVQRLIELGCPKEKVILQHLGVDTKNISYLPRKWEPGEPLRVLIAAFFGEKKGIPYALKALGSIKHKVDLEITILGDASSDPRSQNEKRLILETVRKQELQSKVRLMGFQPYSVLLEEAYKQHVFISPSVTATDGDTEGGAPVTIIEMIASGMPLISTNHCDIPEVVNYGIKDWLVPERDSNALADRLIWLLENYKDWPKMLEKGRTHIDNEFDLQKQGEFLENIYQDVVSNSV